MKKWCICKKFLILESQKGKKLVLSDNNQKTTIIPNFSLLSIFS